MKTLALTIQFEDSVDLRAARQFIEGAANQVPGYRAIKVQEPPPVMPLMGGNGQYGENAPLCVRMDFLCSAQAVKNHHGMTLANLAERGGLHPTEAVALNLRLPYKSMPVTDALQALLMSSKPPVR